MPLRRDLLPARRRWIKLLLLRRRLRAIREERARQQRDREAQR